MDDVHAPDTTARVHGIVQGAGSHQRKNPRALKEKLEDKKKKKSRDFHDELVLSEELSDERDVNPQVSSKEEIEKQSDDETTDEKPSVDDEGHVDFRA